MSSLSELSGLVISMEPDFIKVFDVGLDGDKTFMKHDIRICYQKS